MLFVRTLGKTLEKGSTMVLPNDRINRRTLIRLCGGCILLWCLPLLRIGRAIRQTQLVDVPDNALSELLVEIRAIAK